MKNTKSSHTQRGKNGRFIPKINNEPEKKLIVIGERKTGKTTFVKRVIDEINYRRDVGDQSDFVRLDRDGDERIDTTKLYIPTIYPVIYDVNINNKSFCVVDSPPMGGTDSLSSSRVSDSITSSMISDYQNDYTKNNLLTSNVILIMTREEDKDVCSTYVEKLLSLLEMSYHKDMETFHTKSKHSLKPEPPRVLCIPCSCLLKIKSPATLCIDALYSSKEDLSSSLIKQLPVERPQRIRERSPSYSDDYSSSYYSRDRSRRLPPRSRRSFASSYESYDDLAESRINEDPNPPLSTAPPPSKSRSPLSKEPTSDDDKLVSLADVIKDW